MKYEKQEDMEYDNQKDKLNINEKEIEKRWEAQPFNPMLYENEAESKIIVLIDTLGKMINSEVWKAIKNFNISLTQAQIITYLLFSPNNKKNISYIANSLGVSKPTISRAADNLIDKGIIEKTVNPENRRSHILTLTQKGIQIALHIFEYFSQMRKILANSGGEEKRKILKSLLWILYKLVENKILPQIPSCIFCQNMVSEQDIFSGNDESFWCKKLNLFLILETLKIDCPYFQSKYAPEGKIKVRKHRRKEISV
jgi:DNA-binding MarR family transcriptional regulator